MSTIIYTPYTYLIGWSTHNIWYYGVRFAKGCNPNDLWNPYKTSSKYVKQCINEYGDPDIVEVRRTFSSPISAQRWEEKVLRRMNVVKRKDFLNKTDTNRIKSEAISNGLKKHWANLSTEERKIRSQNAVNAMLAAPRSSFTNPSEWIKRYWNNMTPEERSIKNQISRLATIEYNKNLTREEKSERGRKGGSSPKKIMTCPHCNLTGRGNMKRWHFDNCKLK